jgi:nitrite reductase/ring-hydroxylating ferredoxin subunit
MPASEPTPPRVAVYERDLPVSVERVWENVRDWEHLPWLHAGSFSRIALEDEGAWGWRARIGLPGGAREIRLELVIEEDEPRYVSRTLEGPGAGSEIWTRVEERDAQRSHVTVGFHVPGLDAQAMPGVGERFVALYTRLWDEDESMMVRRAAELAARRGEHAARPRSVGLGPLDALRARLPAIVPFGGDRFRVALVDGALVAHAVVCPHRLGPLAEAPVVDGRVVCPWHGYAFDVATGRECSGRRMRLAEPPRVEIDPASREVRLVAPETEA